MEQPEDHPGPDPRRVHSLSDLARELGLLRARAARGDHRARVSLDELARRVGQPRSTVHAYVTGKHLVPSDVLDEIVIALGATPAEQRQWGESWFRLAARRTPERRTAAPATTAPRQLPPDTHGFTGRVAELAALDQGGPIRVVTGTGGVGKTALAVRWAHRAAADFPDGQLCVDLRGFDPERPVEPADALAGFLRALGVDGAAVPPGAAERAALFRSLLAGRRMLVLLDNARDSEHVRPLLPGEAGCVVLVTSRDSMAGLVARNGAARTELDLLPRADATALLGALAGER
ncbi:MAG TPA: helix-turn-helix domain-containing protein, partial [Pseudonocardiaceae bacterium]